MQTPPRTNQPSGQPVQAPKTPNQPIVGFAEPPPVVRCSKKRGVIQSYPSVRDLGKLFDDISLQQ